MQRQKFQVGVFWRKDWCRKYNSKNISRSSLLYKSKSGIIRNKTHSVSSASKAMQMRQREKFAAWLQKQLRCRGKFSFRLQVVRRPQAAEQRRTEALTRTNDLLKRVISSSLLRLKPTCAGLYVRE